MGTVYTVPVPSGVFHVFSESFGRTDTDRDYAYNLILFKEISRYFKYYNVLGFPLFMINIVGNIVAFAPFGFFCRSSAEEARNGIIQ